MVGRVRGPPCHPPGWRPSRSPGPDGRRAPVDHRCRMPSSSQGRTRHPLASPTGYAALFRELDVEGKCPDVGGRTGLFHAELEARESRAAWLITPGRRPSQGELSGVAASCTSATTPTASCHLVAANPRLPARGVFGRHGPVGDRGVFDQPLALGLALCVSSSGIVPSHCWASFRRGRTCTEEPAADL